MWQQFLAFWETFKTGFIHFLPNLLSIAVILLIGFILTKVLSIPLKALRRGPHVDAVMEKYIRRAVKIVIWFVVLIAVVDKLGVPVTSVLTLFAAVGAAVALAVKESLANLASGIVLLFTKPFKAGDFIEVGAFSGSIREITLMYTYLDTTSNARVAVPNNTMMTATIVNYSVHDTRRQDLLFTVGYTADITKAKSVLQQIAESEPRIAKDPAPLIVVKEHGTSAIVLLMRFWCSNDEFWNLQFSLMERVKQAFDAEGISIPYPQLDVHVIANGMKSE